MPGPCRGHAVKLMYLSYRTRRLVSQETRLAKQPFFPLGTVSITFAQSCFIVRYYTRKLPEKEGISVLVNGDAAVHSARILTNALIGSHPLAVSRPLRLGLPYELLGKHRHSEGSDPRDGVFALLGLLPAFEQRILRGFLPDYSTNYSLVALLPLRKSTNPMTGLAGQAHVPLER